MALRVVHCGTGNVGKSAVKGILNHPDLELVGWYVWSPDKVGMDAGDICGMSKTGVKATNDWNELYALEADCLSFFGDSIGRVEECLTECTRFLERGTNVVSFSGFELAHPPSAPKHLKAPVEAACKAGNTSYFFSGIDPGWATTDMALAALAAVDRVDLVRVLELGFWGHYTAEYVCREYFGFGQPPGFKPLLMSTGYLKVQWEPTLRHIADALGVEIDDWETTYEIDCVKADVETGFGIVKAGTAGAIRFQLIAKSGGKPIAICEHVDQVARDAGLQWKQPFMPYDCTHRVEIEGDGQQVLSVEIGCPPGPASAMRCAMPVINAIPAVCAASPGIKGPLDIPRYFTRNVRR